MIDTSSSAALPECLASRTGYLLARAARQLSERMEDALEPLGLRSRHFSVLAVLSSLGPLTQHRLTGILHIDRTTMVAVVDDLESMGYVERRRDPADRRAYQLHLTADGRGAEARLRGVVDAVQASFFSPLSGQERSDLQHILRRFF